MFDHSCAELRTCRGSFEWDIDSVWRVIQQRCERIKRMLEGRTEEYSALILEYVFSTISVVDVEIENSDFFKSVFKVFLPDQRFHSRPPMRRAC